MNSYCLHFFHKICVNKAYRTHIIVEYSNFHTCFYSLFQNILNLMPCFSVFYRMIFHKDKLLCFLQILKLCL